MINLNELVSLNKPGILSLKDSKSGLTQVLFGKSVVKRVLAAIDLLQENSYPNRELQEAFNNGTLEFSLVELIEDKYLINDVVLDMVMRYKSASHLEAMTATGTLVVPMYNPPALTVKPRLLRREHPQVVVVTARNKKLYVQKEFTGSKDINRYIVDTDILQVLIDTKGINKPYRRVKAMFNNNTVDIEEKKE